MTVNKRQIKGLLFDAGGILITIDFDVLEKTLKELLFKGSGTWNVYETIPNNLHFEIAEQLARPLLDALLQRASSEVSSTRLQFLTYIWNIAWKRATGTKESPSTDSELFKEWAHIIEIRHQSENLWQRMIPGTREALEKIQKKGLVMGVVSNADGRVEEILERLGIAKFFSIIIDSHIEKVEKPNPEIFIRALKRLNLKAEETIYIGDFYSIDVVGARKGGLGAVLMDPANAWNCNDVPRISSLDQLADFIDSLPNQKKTSPWNP
jgi:HAD superfamily hydrolase (TIGR01662 family)